MPHTHPWHFNAYPLTGGYRQDVYTVERPQLLSGIEAPLDVVDVGNVRLRPRVSVVAGTRNEMPLDVAHEVVEVEPGTLSLMVCGPGRKDGWGYIDPDSGLYIPVTKSPIEPSFKAALYALNPHKK